MQSEVAKMLLQAAETFEERHQLYGDNYKRFGKVMCALFPNGLKIESQDDWNRLGMLVQMTNKLTRYATNFEEGGHDDSLLDQSVYCNMLRELDQEVRDSRRMQYSFSDFAERIGRAVKKEGDYYVKGDHSQCEE